MLPEIGNLALATALLLALAQGMLPIAGAQRNSAALMAVARPTAATQFAFVALAFACLALAFLGNDFSVENVARNSHTRLPAVYRLTATWGSHEGSMLLWALMLSGWTAALAALERRAPPAFIARVMGVLGLVSSGFLGFVLFASNPFRRLSPVPVEGADMNPLLQDPGMVLHPPVLYMGYVGFAVAFAFALAALLAPPGEDAAWARRARPWTAAAWAFLTAGIGLGSWWAYNELGWGGWWFWDPTENASLMPWLAGTALLHALAATARHGALPRATLLLAVTTFSLSLLGTFLVRSGVLSSIHAFASDPLRGAFILAFLALVVGGSLALYALRASRLPEQTDFGAFSRESLLLANAVLLVVLLGSVMLGTLYPLLLDALGFDRISVGKPYFDAVFVPLALPVLLLAGLGPLVRHGRDLPRRLAASLRVPFVVSLAGGLALPWLLGEWRPWTAVGLVVALWIGACVASGTIGAWRAWRAGRPGRRFWAMQTAHLGLALLTAGIALVSDLASERDVALDAGEAGELAGHVFVFRGAHEVPGPNYRAMRGEVEVRTPGRAPVLLHPEKRVYLESGMAMTEAAVESGPWGDVYVALGEPLGGRRWSLRLFVKPYVGWIWAGAALMVAGGLLAMGARRRAPRRQPSPQPVLQELQWK